MTETAISVERKYDAELSWWRDALENTVQWHMGKAKTVWGWPCVPNPVSVVRDPEAAVLSIRKEYLARYPGILDLPVERSYGKLLELGSGPLCPAAVFRSQLLVAVDPLMLRYAAIGYPLHRYQAVCLNARVEDLGSLLPSGMFDTIVSHDAIDHMDCFRRVAQQIIWKVPCYEEVCYNEVLSIAELASNPRQGRTPGPGWQARSRDPGGWLVGLRRHDSIPGCLPGLPGHLL
jgi:hypothetical protein